ncbi:MAG: Ig-like domain-containing protein [Verrucomicrobiota bacterium]|jgi:hypothetical protein
MNDPQTMPSLESPVAAELPTRLLRSPYFILRTPIGGYYLDPAFNGNLVKSPVNSLSLFLADAQRVPAPGSDLGEVKYQPRENLRPLRYIHEGALKEFAEAASNFCKGGLNADQASLRQGFRLPDPGKEPDAYWVCGDRFAPRLLIIWGCEKEQGSSLPLVGDGRNVVKELRAKAMSWTRLFREGVELSRLKDPLAAYIAFPVLSEDGKLTHVDRLVNGQYVREEVYAGRGKSWKVRPLKRLPGRVIQQFQKTAEDFYRQAHGSGCACSSCAPGGALKPSAPAKAPPPVLSYEQEVRRGFRLPDPDLRPDAYFVAGHTLGEQLLILCPNPGIKDAEEIAQLEKDLKWTEDKARTPEDKELARQLRQQFEENLAQHNLYKRYFYADHECLPLTSDKVLGLPVPAPKPSAGPGPLPVPTARRPKTEAKPSEQTVAGKLKSINWGKLVTIWAGVLFLIVAGVLAANHFIPKRLVVLNAAMSNDAVLDPGNQRNVIEIEFNNRLGQNHPVATNQVGVTNQAGAPPALLGQYSLRFNGGELKLRPPELNPTNHKRLTLTIDLPGVALSEDGKYTLYLEKARDFWGHVLAPTNLPVLVDDKRPPSLVGEPSPASADAQDSLKLKFDEPLDKANAETAGNYSIEPGLSIKSAQLQEDRQTVVLKADKPFESDARYQLTLRTNITDASTNKNHLRPLSTNFNYIIIPLQVESVSAKDSQTRIKIVFNKPFDPNSAKTKGVLQLGGLEVGPVQALDSKSLEVVLTNSYMTNGSYTLRIAGLKDTSGKAGAELATTNSFAYEGPIDRTAPILVNESSATSNRLELTFNKDLREDAATKISHYTLRAKNGTEWQKVGTPFLPHMTSASNIVLSFAANLPIGILRLEYSGVEDLVGNAANGTKEGRNGIDYPPSVCKGVQFANAGHTEIHFSLTGQIDTDFCANPANFLLESTEGAPVPGLRIVGVEIRHVGNTSDIHLVLSDVLKADTFQVHYSHMRPEGVISETDGLATRAT